MKRIAALFISLLTLSNFLFTSTASAAGVGFSNIWVGNVTPGSGHVGVDIWWPDHGESQYNPCHHSNDIYYGACVMSNVGPVSYYKVKHFSPSGTDFPSGVFVDNQNLNYCKTATWCLNKTAQSFNHGWGRLVTGAALEFYPYGTEGTYNPYTSTVGGLRVQVDSFPVLANGGRYSKNIGNVTLPTIGQPNVGKLNGFVTASGVAASANRVSIDAFQNGSTRTSSTGYPLSGFSSIKNKGDGYYNIGAVPSGRYKIYITDHQTNHKVILDNVNVVQAFERLDFKLEQRCFGQQNQNCQDPAQ